MSHSRLNEEEVIQRLIAEVPNISKVCVDIGASSGAAWSNVWKLLEQGWEGLLCECVPEKASALVTAAAPFKASVVTAKITPFNASNIVSTLAPNVSVLSLDIDGYDSAVLHNIIFQTRPNIICCEVNPCVPPPIRFCVNYDPNYWWGCNTFFGMSIQRTDDLMACFGYKLREVCYDNVIYSLHGQGRNLIEAWEEGFLNVTGEGHPDFGQNISRNLRGMTHDDAKAFIKEMWKEYEGKYDLW